MTVRAAAVDDAPALARLAAELGYATEPETMRRRLELLVGRPDHAVLVAQRMGRPSAALEERVFGWMHVGLAFHLESGESAEIFGLVVDRRARRSGLGGRLVAAAEVWSRAQGFDHLVVRSNAARSESHQFYPALGFVASKTQRVYVKALGDRLSAAPTLPDAG